MSGFRNCWCCERQNRTAEAIHTCRGMNPYSKPTLRAPAVRAHLGRRKVSFQVPVLPLTEVCPWGKLLKFLHLWHRENSVISEGDFKTDGDEVCKAFIMVPGSSRIPWMAAAVVIKGSILCVSVWRQATVTQLVFARHFWALRRKGRKCPCPQEESITCTRTDVCNSRT